VDRGYHQVEVLTLLFALKVAYPERIWLLRGNHESESMNEMYGFKAACLKTFETSAASRAFARAQEVFQWLPLAALVEQPGTKPALVLHGGIGNGEWRIDDVRQLGRPLPDPKLTGLAEQILWSDPSDSDAEMNRGVHGNPQRGEGMVRFGPDVTARFCAMNGIGVVIRSHQVVHHGYKVMHGGRLLTVFSARNYLGRNTNDAALLLLATDCNGDLRVRFKQLRHHEDNDAEAA
jgi:diadenosine tetraphosphatase ApaH/serine/threonine PP2A family protein phosphatase